MIVCVVGLGYVGLPLTVEFGKKMKCIGFDECKERIKELADGRDKNEEVSLEELEKSRVEFSSEAERIGEADFVIVAVPTPIDEEKKPDLKALEQASVTVAKNMKSGCIVIYESTVWPGVTEEICVPILEKESGRTAGKEFKVAYSPERVNPGEREHSLANVVKIVSGMDKETTEKVRELYETIIEAGIYIAPDIKTAEAAKAIENVQRDLNIALVNELSKIFNRNGLDTEQVLKAAGTKWNFHSYQPGLVGGHCIPVDPYYLVEKAKKLGYEPKVILAGREINNSMAEFVAELAEKGIKETGKNINGARIAVLGLTFKENVGDDRNSGAKKLSEILGKKGAEVFEIDPFLKIGNIKKLESIDCFVLAVPHKKFGKKEKLLETMAEKARKNPVLIDVKWFLSREEAEKAGFNYKRL